RGGSDGYVAPEQEAGAPADARADLYAAGVLLWELCAGRRFDRTPLDGAPALAAIAARATPAGPAARLADAAEMLGELSRYLREVHDAPTQAALSARVRRQFPDVPAAAGAADAELRADAARPAGPSTRPLDGRRPRQVTFATRVA